MKKYTVSIEKSTEHNASSKARKDAEAILLKNGYELISFDGAHSAEGNPLKQAQLLFTTWKNWRKLEKQAETGSLMVIQYPHYPLKTSYLLTRLLPGIQKRKQIRFAALVHDLNSLRDMYGQPAVYSDTKFLPLFDRIICHNESMKEVLTGWGIPAEKMVSLEIFDYLTEEPVSEHHPRDGIAVAGNLDPEKCGYIGKLMQAEGRTLPLHLYGKGFPEELRAENIFFHGAFPAEELPGRLEGGFGLVWDGPEITSCMGKMGEYLLYNNPHKLSLYLASGLPVIIWKEAAEAKFVEENGVGLAVNSLEEAEKLINEISEEAYREMALRARETGEGLRKGARLETALHKTEA